MSEKSGKNSNPPKQKAWVVSVNMGYGHQRTAYPLKSLAFEGKIIQANSYQDIPKKDHRIWETTRKFYEFISDFKKIPLVGSFGFAIFNELQKILNFYPKRDLSQPNFSLRQIFSLIKRGWGEHLIEKISLHKTFFSAEPDKKHIPLITTFFTPAFMAEAFNYPGDIFCVVCDADISRAWVAIKPELSRIKYLASTKRVVERLKLYGVKPENILLSGYPLPLENIGTEKLEILKHDSSYRLLNLDPKGKYCWKYESLIREYIGDLPEKPNHCLTLMFAVGGAGAQKEISIDILKSLARKIRNRNTVKVVLVAGIRAKVKNYFLKKLKHLGMEDCLGKNIEIIFSKNIEDYFQKFNQALKTTDILWTKPSEISFYTALGLPIIIAPSIGYQEDFNKEWLLRLGSGMPQKNPKYTDQWLFDLLDSGWFAEAAMQGFVEGRKLGTFNIAKIINDTMDC